MLKPIPSVPSTVAPHRAATAPHAPNPDRDARTPLSCRPFRRRLLVAGWNDDTEDLISALEQAGNHRAVAIGDHSAVPLTRAREATGLPCYRHLREMLTRVEHDALLIAAPGLVADIAPAAAEAGTTLILDPGTLSAEELVRAARVAIQHESAVRALRPRLRAPGIAELLALAAEEPEWRPGYLDITFEARDASPLRLLDDAVATLATLVSDAPERVVASAWGDPDGVGAIVAEVRYGNGRLGSIRARTGLFERLLVNGEAPAGTIDLRIEGGDGLLALCSTDEPARLHRFDVDPPELLALESARIASPPADATGDAAALLRESTIRGAIEQAIESGHSAPLDGGVARPHLQLVAGLASAPTPRRQGHLRLVNA